VTRDTLIGMTVNMVIAQRGNTSGANGGGHLVSESSCFQHPVRLCCMQRHLGPICPDGKVMCQLCYDRFDMADLYVDEHGDRWDVCRACQENDALHG